MPPKLNKVATNALQNGSQIDSRSEIQGPRCKVQSLGSRRGSAGPRRVCSYIWSSSAVTNCQKHVLRDAINASCFCLLVRACEDAGLHMIQHNQMHFAAADPNMMDAHLPPQSAAHFKRMRLCRLSSHSRNCQDLEAREAPCHAEQRCRVSKHQQPPMMVIALMPMMNTNS